MVLELQPYFPSHVTKYIEEHGVPKLSFATYNFAFRWPFGDSCNTPKSLATLSSHRQSKELDVVNSSQRSNSLPPVPLANQGESLPYELSETQLRKLATAMAHPMRGVERRTRRHRVRKYKDCFIGCSGVQWLMSYLKCDESTAAELGERMRLEGYIVHVVDINKPFKNQYLFYRFRSLGDADAANRTTLLLEEEVDLSDISAVLSMLINPLTGVPIRDRTWRFKTYKHCFVASELVDWCLLNLTFRRRKEALKFCQRLVDEALIRHVCDPQPFKDAYLFFEFSEQVLLENSELSLPSRAESVRDEKKISLSDFEILRVLGVGGSGKVIKVRHKTSGEIFALKSVDKGYLKRPKDVEHLLTERQLLANKSPFMLHLHHSFQTPTKLYFVMDYVSGGDLFNYVIRFESGLPVNVVAFLTAEVFLALDHLHQAGFIYR